MRDKTQKQDSIRVSPFLVTEELKLSHSQYTHFASGVLQNHWLNAKFDKRAMFLKNNSPGSKADFPDVSKSPYSVFGCKY